MKNKRRHHVFTLITVASSIAALSMALFYFIFFKSSVSEKKSDTTAHSIAEAPALPEAKVIDQLLSQCALINVTPLSISFNPKEPQLVQLTFESNEKADRFKDCLKIAEGLIPDIFKELSFYNDLNKGTSNQVILKSCMPIRFEPTQANSYFQIASKLGEQDPMYLYCPLIKEADQNFTEKDYAAALENYQKVATYLRNNGLSDPSDLLKALCGSMFCYDLLCQEPFAKAAFDELVYEVALLGEKVETVNWFRDSVIYPKYKNKQNRYVARIETVGLPEMTPEENCQLQCNGYALAASWACSKVPVPAIQAVCYGCIFGLDQLCMRCCKGAGFWENCVRGLRRLFHDPNHPENPAPHPNE